MAVDSIKGLLVLSSILNDDVKEYFRQSCAEFKNRFERLEKCGWAQAMKESRASYKQEVKIENLGHPQHAPQAHHQGMK